MDRKNCEQCGEVKLLSEFYFSKTRKKHNSYCKECHSFNCQLYYLKNKQKCKDNFARYYSEHKERHREIVKRWHKENKYIGSYTNAKTKAKEKELPFELTGKDVKELFAPPKVCAITGKQLKFHTEHARSDSPCMLRNSFEKGWTKRSVKLVCHGEVMKRVGVYNHKRAIERNKDND